MKLCCITKNLPHLTIHRRYDLDRFRESLAKNLDDLLDERPEQQRHPFPLRTTREEEHLTDHVRPTLDIAVHDREPALGILVRIVHLQQLNRHQHRGQYIIQIVRNSAGQRAETFETLRTKKLCLKSLLLRNVLGCSKQ